VEEGKGREHNSGTTAQFGQSSGRADNLEGGQMEHRKDRNQDKATGNVTDTETTRRPNSERETSTGQSGSIGNMGGGGSDFDRDLDRESGRRGHTGELGETERKGGGGEGRL
jgi:hypothetical protein